MTPHNDDVLVLGICDTLPWLAKRVLVDVMKIEIKITIKTEMGKLSQIILVVTSLSHRFLRTKNQSQLRSEGAVVIVVLPESHRKKSARFNNLLITGFEDDRKNQGPRNQGQGSEDLKKLKKKQTNGFSLKASKEECSSTYLLILAQ